MFSRFTLISALIIYMASPIDAAYSYFHPPRNDMEIAVDKAIHTINSDDAWGAYLLYRTEADEKKDAINYQTFTMELMHAWREAEAEQVYRNCGGRYIDGKRCGFDFNPLSCMTFTAPHYAYRTDSQASYFGGAYNGLVTMRQVGGQQLVASYHLKKIGENWLIDGVECHVEGLSFNMN